MSKKRYRAPEIEWDQTLHNDPVEEQEVIVEDAVEEQEAIVEDTPDVTKTVYGTVFKCSMVNIRKAPEKNAPVVATIRRNNTVTVDIDESTAEFYKIRTLTGIEGFCMREFIDIQE